MIPCHVLFHDADGCLNDADGSPLAFDREFLSDRDKQGLAELGTAIDSSSLLHFVLNTGRSWQATEFLCDAIGSQKLTYALVEHGSELWDVKRKSAVSLEPLAAQSATTTAIQAVASRFDINRLIGWFDDVGERELCNLLDYSGSFERQRDKQWNLTFWVPEDIDGERVNAALKRLLAKQAETPVSRLEFHYSQWNRYLDVMAEMDKGFGVALVLERLGIERKYSAAIGDGLNDLPMLQAVALPMCPANAAMEVVAACREGGHVATRPYLDATLDWLKQG